MFSILNFNRVSLHSISYGVIELFDHVIESFWL